MFLPASKIASLAEASADYVIILEDSGVLRYANPAFVRVIAGGQDPCGNSLFQYLEGTSADRAKRALAPEGQRYTRVELSHDREGRPCPVDYSFCRIEGGVAAIGRDKTRDLQLLGEIVQLNLKLEEKQLQLADVNARLKELADTDEVTGLYNRHHFFDVVQILHAEARRYELPMCCFMMDADHFKNLNDTFGHMFGDHVLKGIAQRLRRSIRASDVLARYGGEEFVLVAPNTDLETGLMLAERVRSAIAREPFTLDPASTAVTISVGVAGTESLPRGTFEELLRAADEALYAAKKGGRNRCQIWSIGLPAVPKS